ncbi:MAG: hypothetical protein ACK56I_05945, partial [bacterium]
ARVLVLGHGEFAPGGTDVVAVAVPIDAQRVGIDQTPVVPGENPLLAGVFDVGGQFERLGAPARGFDELQKFERFAPEVIAAAPADVFFAAGRPVADGSEHGAVRGGRAGRAEIADHRVARGLPGQTVQGHGEFLRADQFAEGEERRVAREVIADGRVAEVDLD